MFLRSLRASGLLSALLLAGTTGGACFEPKTQEGLLCSELGACPVGQSCIEGTCYLVGNEPPVDASVDATTFECTAQTLAAGANGASALDAIDADTVFWTENAGSTVLRSPKVAGTTEVFHDSGLGKTPFSLASDGTNVYWTENDALGRVMRKTKTSAGIDLAVELAINQGEPSHLVIDATHVYWTSSAAGTVSRVVKGGGGLEVVAASQGTPTVLAIDDTRLFWVNETTGQVMRANKDGTGLQQLAGAQGAPSDITISADAVYWAATENNEIRTVGKDGGAVSILHSEMGVTDLTASGGHIYWSNKDTGNISRIALGGGDPQLVVDGQSEAISLHFAESLYWLNSLDATNRVVRASCNSL